MNIRALWRFPAGSDEAGGRKTPSLNALDANFGP
jgi:hypothetical protein